MAYPRDVRSLSCGFSTGDTAGVGAVDSTISGATGTAGVAAFFLDTVRGLVGAAGAGALSAFGSPPTKAPLADTTGVLRDLAAGPGVATGTLIVERGYLTPKRISSYQI